MITGIALGSNLGDRRRHVREALDAMLAVPGVTLRAVAPLYESEPVDCPPGSKPFLNTVVEVHCSLEPLELLRVLQEIEVRLGRPARHARHAPRSIDLDILYMDNLTVNSAELCVPHPRLAERRFVLEPLAAIRPDLTLAGRSGCAADWLASLSFGSPAIQCVDREWGKPELNGSP